MGVGVLVSVRANVGVGVSVGKSVGVGVLATVEVGMEVGVGSSIDLALQAERTNKRMTIKNQAFFMILFHPRNGLSWSRWVRLVYGYYYILEAWQIGI